MDEQDSIDRRLKELSAEKQRRETRPLDMCAAERQSAKDALRSRAQRLRREADRLEILCQSLPERLNPDADEALWQLAIKQ